MAIQIRKNHVFLISGWIPVTWYRVLCFLHHLQAASISRCGWKSCYRGLLCDDSARFIPSKKKNVLRVFDLHTHCLKLYMVMLEIFYVYYKSIYVYIFICIYIFIYILILPRPPHETHSPMASYSLTQIPCACGDS